MTVRFPSRTAAALLLALALPAFFLRPLARHAADCVPCSLSAESSAPLDMAPGDHLQLLYHFGLLGDYVRGDLPWFRDLWQFNASDDARPRTPDPCYAPAALPFLVLRAAGCPEALAWNAVHLAFLLSGFLFCAALARRAGATPAEALFAAALAGCIPYRYVTIATGSPTGFGMGLVPGVLLGADLASRDRSLRGGLLCGALLVLLYATDLHCFLFAAAATPLWCLLAPIAFPAPEGAPRPPRRDLFAALVPVAAALAATAALGAAARAGYAGTNVEEGRTLAEVARHSPDWTALFSVDPAAPLAGQLKTGFVLPALFVLAAARFCAALAAAIRVRNARGIRRAAGGLLLAGAVAFSFLLAVGTNGPFGGLPLRIVRALVPPFRLVRQPVKVLCLLPALAAALAGAAFAVRRRTDAAASRRRRLFATVAAVVLVAAAACDARRGLRTGLCRLVDSNAAYAAAAGAATARGAVPRAVVLPVTRGDAPVAAAYQYWARRSRLRILDGYAAVRSRAYERDVYGRFRTMEEGDLTDDQLRGLRACGATAVLVHEDVLARVNPPFPCGATLRRFLADPRLRFLAADRGVWAFELLPDGEESVPLPYAPTVEPAMRHWRFDPPEAGVRAKADCAAEVRRGSCGWLVRAEAGEDLRLVSSHRDPDRTLHEVSADFPADPEAPADAFRLVWLPAPFAGSNRVVRLASRGGARVSDAMFAAAAATGGVRRIAFADLPHRWGETVPGPDGSLRGLRFAPGRAPACLAVSGPFLPLSPVPVRLRLSEFRARLAFPDGTDPRLPELELVRADGSRAPLRAGDELPCDPTEPVSFEVRFDPADGRTLELDGLVLEEAGGAAQPASDR